MSHYALCVKTTQVQGDFMVQMLVAHVDDRIALSPHENLCDAYWIEVVSDCWHWRSKQGNIEPRYGVEEWEIWAALVGTNMFISGGEATFKERKKVKGTLRDKAQVDIVLAG